MKCCYIVIASDQGERGNLTCLTIITTGLLRPLCFALGSRNDASIDAFTLGGGEELDGPSDHSRCRAPRRHQDRKCGTGRSEAIKLRKASGLVSG
ncbi:MAG: hypothetical protein HW395_766 [candidate division NC10 bacterium]|nr:hypothetical protein [candidate division NC10 bacterium]